MNVKPYRFIDHWRIRSNFQYAVIRRRGKEWTAEIHDTTTGVLVRFAGTWKTRKAACGEAFRVMRWL